MTPARSRWRRVRRAILATAVVLLVAAFVYFPGRQFPIAFTLATGIGVRGLQARVDQAEDKAIRGEEFTDGDKRFLRDLYTCFAKGGRLTIVLRQSSEMMRRYLSRSGEDLRTAPRIFVNSRPVQEQVERLRERILQDAGRSATTNGAYASAPFYMGDPAFFDSFVGLYFGRVIATLARSADGRLIVRWRAECPWEWPTYASLHTQYGEHHAQNFPLPNATSLIFGSRHCLRLDDGLGGHLATLGLAKPFLVYAEWTEELAEGR